MKIKNQILIGILGIEILTCGIVIENRILNPKIKNENLSQKIEIENGRIVGDDKEAYGFADLSLKIEVENLNPNLYRKEPVLKLTESDRKIIEYIVAGEAKGESMEGKMAVAQCLLNAIIKDNLSASDVREKYQYSGWDDELQNSNPDCWNEICEAVSRVFDDGEFVSENPILYFYAPKWAKSNWHESLPKDQVIGGHSFHYLEEDVNADWFMNLKGVI